METENSFKKYIFEKNQLFIPLPFSYKSLFVTAAILLQYFDISVFVLQKSFCCKIWIITKDPSQLHMMEATREVEPQMPHKTEAIQGQGWNQDYMDETGCVRLSPSLSMMSGSLLISACT